MKVFIAIMCLFLAMPAVAQTPQLTAREIEKLQKEKKKKCSRTLNTIGALLAKQTLKDIIRDTYFVARANGYIAAYTQLGCEADPLLNTLNRAPLLKK